MTSPVCTRGQWNSVSELILRDGRGRDTILAAFPFAVHGVAWDEHDGVEVAVRKQSGACDLPAIVNGFAVGDSEVRTGGNEIIQVDHGAARLPNEAVHFEPFVRTARCADDLTSRIDGVRYCTQIVSDRPYVSHDSVFPEVGRERLIAFGCSETSDFAGIV